MTVKVIGLWLDRESDSDEPSWIVSKDMMNSKGEAEDTTTIATYAEDDYADARAHAKDCAQRFGVCVIETDKENRQECIYHPEGAVNPLQQQGE